jgi:hypothetical protein
MTKEKKFIKIIDERFVVPENQGGGIIKFEAWENEGKIIKYSMAYINFSIFSEDNGRVMGYDNAHDYHHKHYLGEISEVADFVNYQEMVERFKQDIKEFILW